MTIDKISVISIPSPAITVLSLGEGLQGPPGTSAAKYIEAVPPPEADSGDFWWDSSTGQLMILYDDGNSEQWVQANSSPQGPTGPAGPQGPTGPTGPQGPTGSPGSTSWNNLTDKPTLGTAAALDVPATGNASVTEVVLGTDSRLSNARTPTSHAHDDLYFTESEVTSALNLKANLDSPTFTGTVSGITASMVNAPSGSGTSSGTNTGDQDLSGKQDVLVSGTNIKTLNGSTLLGSGDVAIVGGVTVSAAAPSTPANGQGWFDTTAGIGYLWVDDGDSSAWVESGTVGVSAISNIYGLQTSLDGKAALSSAQTFTGAQRGSVTALTSTGASIAIDLAVNNNFSHTITENTTLAAPSNPVAGQMSQIYITQGATPRLLAFNTFYKFPGGTVPTLTATASAVDLLVLTVPLGATYAICQLIKDIK